MGATAVTSNKKELYIGATLLFASGLFLILSLTPGHEWGGDFAAYIHQGRALASGSIDHLDLLVRHRIEHSSGGYIVGPDYYPWGFPTLLALVILIFGESLFAMKALVVAFVLGTQVVTYFLFRGRLPTMVGLAIAFAVGVNSFIFDFKDAVLSDLPFTFFALLTLLLCRINFLEGRNPSIRGLAGIGLSMLIAYSMRTHAVALLPTVALVQLIGKSDFKTQPLVAAFFNGLLKFRPRDFIPHVVFVMGVAGLTALLTDPIESYVGSGHMESEVGLIKKTYYSVSRGLHYYGLLPNQLFEAPKAVYAVVIVPLLLVGVAKGTARNADLLAFVFCHMAVLMVFPGRQGLRFILPVIPILFFFLFIGGQAVAGWLRLAHYEIKGRSIADVVLAVLLVFGVSGPTAASEIQDRLSGKARLIQTGPYEASSQEVFAFIEQNIGADESIIFWKPRVLSYFTGRRSAYCVQIDDITNGEHQYVLVYSGEYRYREMADLLSATVSAYPEKFDEIYSNSDFVLYAIKDVKGRRGQ